jgi:hypothetical protein
MIIQCDKCQKYYDDEFRDTSCPHDTFLANDGQNNFKHYVGAWLAYHMPKRGFSDPAFEQGLASEHDRYEAWRQNNKVNINE